jgi:cytoskeletal protein RodZ
MEAIGEKLRQAREQKNLNFDQISRETNIAKRYLVALEEEDFAVFPGEPYLLGFLKNYADYLGLKPDELVTIYKNLKIQEQPIPVKELLSVKQGPKPLTIGVVGGVIILAVLAIVLAVVLSTRAEVSHRGGLSDANRNHADYQFEKSPFDKRLYVGDSVTLELKGEKYRLSIKSIDDAVEIDTPNGQVKSELGKSFSIDFDSDNLPDLLGTVRDFVKGSPDKGAEMHFESEAVNLATLNTQAPADALASAADPNATVAPQATAVAVDASKSQVLIESKNTPFPFTLSVNFRQYCMFRFEVDKKDRTERYYRKGEIISASANNGMKIWMSNAASCSVQVIAAGKTVNVDLGRPGEVVVKYIKWVQTESGSWALTALPLN